MTGMKQGIPKSVDEYITAQPEAVRQKLERVPAAIGRSVAEAAEAISLSPISSLTDPRPWPMRAVAESETKAPPQLGSQGGRSTDAISPD